MAYVSNALYVVDNVIVQQSSAIKATPPQAVVAAAAATVAGGALPPSPALMVSASGPTVRKNMNVSCGFIIG
ncbi:hypothetical protein AKJ16_DCAP11203 [Drosera capensis]